MAIHKHSVLRNAVGAEMRIEKGGTQVIAAVYHLLPADLRSNGQGQLGSTLDHILSPERPLLVLAECIFPYMTSAESQSLLRMFSSFENVAAVIYEMFGLQDSFGKVMLANLQSRSVELPGVGDFDTLESQRNRFLENGYNSAGAMTLKDVRLTQTPEEELGRLSKIELLDELEELDLVLSHYAIVCGSKTDASWTKLFGGM